MLWMNKNVPAVNITVVHLFRWLCLECGDSVWIAFEKLGLLCIFHVFPLSIYSVLCIVTTLERSPSTPIPAPLTRVRAMCRGDAFYALRAHLRFVL